MALIGAGVIALAPMAYAQALPTRSNRQAQTNQTQQQSSGPRAVERPPSPQRPDNPPVWLYYLVAAAMTAGVVTVSIMPSKRGHQD